MSCSNIVTVSRGSSFGCTFAWTPGTTGPANLLDTTLTSSVEDYALKVYPLTVTKAVDGLSFTCIYEGDTEDWALGLGRWDIKFVFNPGSISHSEVFRVQVVDSVTA